jgi:hypothetical protein
LPIYTIFDTFTCIVNIDETVNPWQWEALALQLLRSVPGVHGVETQDSVSDGRRVDAIVRFSDRSTPVILEVKRHANAATARQLIDYAGHHDRDAAEYILVAGDSTTEARALLAEHGIGLIDGLGNAHVELPGLLVHMEQRRRTTARPTRPNLPRLTGKAGVVAQALLLQPERAWKVADVAGMAGVSAGLAHRVLTRLETENVMKAEGMGPRRNRRVVNPTALLDLWVEETTTERQHRVLAHVVARTPEARMRDLTNNLNARKTRYAVTGASAAVLLAPLVTAIPITEVWLSANVLATDALATAHAEHVAEGANVVFLQMKGDEPLAFAQRHQGIKTVNVFRLYADLRRDPRRGREQADNLRREVIGF